jgi:uncharacterized protein
MVAELDEKQIDVLLNQQVIGRIACYDEDVIYLVPTSYGYDGEYIYMHSQEGKKIELMRKNPNICFEVDNISDLSNWESVIAWGKFEELKDTEERNKALRILIHRHLPLNSSITTHLGSTWPFSDGEEVNEIEGVVFRFKITSKTGRYECDSSPDLGYD